MNNLNGLFLHFFQQMSLWYKSRILKTKKALHASHQYQKGYSLCQSKRFNFCENNNNI